ncbi:uncharacterized protein LOC129595569 [Paramacrobiotus metropolitanus]|uniref:uncharacterized protein LOC129595569 n=1 Tax=Paramacrobiotus metropolitanus TaxID=2943436 RepID=UPI0024457BE9|nr:uncharacterized protein LOC129595569 [Paramacrobiotus metropolitanus]
MNQITAMLSYWMDLHYPRLSTSNPALLSLFSSSVLPMTEYVYTLRLGALLFLVVLPFTCVGLVQIVIVSKIFLHGLTNLLCAGLESNKAHQNVHDTEDSNDSTSDGEPEDVPTVKKNAQSKVTKRFCICALWGECQGVIMLTLQRTYFSKYLPIAVVAFAFPENRQLPAVLLLLSGITVVVCYELCVAVFE